MLGRFKNFLLHNEVLILVVLIQFFQIFYLNTNITNYDGCQYSLSAREWAENGVNLNSEIFYSYTNYGAITEYRFNTSLLTILPLTLFIKIFGFNLLTTQIYAFLSSLLIILLLKLYTFKLFNEQISNLTIFIYSLFPINVYMTASFLTDANSNLIILIVIICFYFGYRNSNTFSYFLLFLSGVLSMLSIFVRQWIPLIIIVTVLFSYFYFGKIRKKILLYILGCFIGFILIFIISFILTNDLFYFVRIYTEYGADISKVHFLESPLFVFQMLFHVDNFSFIFVLLPIFILSSLVNRERVEIFFIIWILLIYLLFEVFLRLFINLPKYHGYLNILLLPLSIYLSVFLFRLNIQEELIKYLKIIFILWCLVLLISKFIDFSYFNYLYYTNLSNIRKYGIAISILIVLSISFYYKFAYFNKPDILKLLLLFALIILNIFSTIVILSRSYETSIMIRTVKLISEDKVRFYNLKNSEYPFRILCTNPTMLLPYYHQLFYNHSYRSYDLKMAITINDFDKKGFFLFVDKHSSFKWEPQCFDELEDLRESLLLNNIPLKKFYDFGNYSLWEIK